MSLFSEDHKEIASGKKQDDEGYMARIELDNIEKSVKRLRKVVKTSKQQLPAWVQSKITRAADYIDTAAEYLSSDEELDEGISFNINPEKHRSEVQPPIVGVDWKPPTLTERILAEMGCDCDMKPHMGVNEIAKKHNTSVERIEKQLKRGIKVEMEHTTDKYEAESIALQHLAERPDYYTRLMKVESKKYMTKDEDPCWKGYEMVGFKKKRGKKVPNCVPVNEGVRIQSQSGQLMYVMLNWRNKVIVTQMFFPQVRIPKKLEVLAAVEKVYPGAKVISFRVSDINPKMPLVQVNEEQAWQKINRKDNVDGLSQDAVKAYRRENPGSKLQTAVTEKKPKGKRKKRRANFCRRMKGMKSKLTSSKTARDPNSRINKALRRWRCR